MTAQNTVPAFVSQDGRVWRSRQEYAEYCEERKDMTRRVLEQILNME